LAPEVVLLQRNLFGAFMRAGRLDDAEKLLDQGRAGALDRAVRNGVKGDPQQFSRAWIRLKRDPGLAETIHKELGDKEFKRLQITIADEIDSAFDGTAALMEKHVNGADPVIALRRSKFDAYRKDPRYLRLMNKAGFDDEGKIQ
jgi:hypothetical protein